MSFTLWPVIKKLSLYHSIHRLKHTSTKCLVVCKTDSKWRIIARMIWLEAVWKALCEYVNIRLIRPNAVINFHQFGNIAKTRWWHLQSVIPKCTTIYCYIDRIQCESRANVQFRFIRLSLFRVLWSHCYKHEVWMSISMCRVDRKICQFPEEFISNVNMIWIGCRINWAISHICNLFAIPTWQRMNV